ncbi:hypothetical protein AALP_AA8G382500 [Arabis alpina]|uniref:Uncharacterized protein n=1 Tax=Arabis alpina TaxID=50452 RepID=A0A087GC38_ARAAL|nr:hypothetical protein AALP_AA8G382500 [Arabis alpina]
MWRKRSVVEESTLQADRSERENKIEVEKKQKKKEEDEENVDKLGFMKKEGRRIL